MPLTTPPNRPAPSATAQRSDATASASAARAASPDTRLPNRPLGMGYLRAFDAVARHLNFRAAGDELALTQSAVSRQIQALEDDVGVPLFLRHTRAVELTSAGSELLRAAQPALERMDAAVRHIRRSAGRTTVSVSTTASFASMWLIPRLEAFQSAHPDIDIRIDATDVRVDLDTSDVDLAIRYYTVPGNVDASATRLFGEQLAPVASPWLLKTMAPLRSPADLAQCALLEASDTHRNLEQLSWRRWLTEQHQPLLEPKRWLYFNYAHQIAQAALTGQGIALARMPLVADSLRSGDLVEVLPGSRLDTTLAHWLLPGPRSRSHPHVQAFAHWLQEQAALTREALGEGAQNTDLSAHPD